MESLTVSNSVQVITPSLYKDSAMSGGASAAFLTNYGAAIRYSYCPNVTPSATVGHVLPDGGVLTLLGQQQLADFKCIRQTSVDSIITITVEYE